MNKPQISKVKTHPAGAAKKRDPIIRGRVIANLWWSVFWLDVLRLVAPAGAVSQDCKKDHSKQNHEHDDDRDLDGGEQKASESNKAAEQRYHQ